VLDILLESLTTDDPIEMLKETLSKANAERMRINKEIGKRKGEAKDKEGPPNKKPRITLILQLRITLIL